MFYLFALVPLSLYLDNIFLHCATPRREIRKATAIRNSLSRSQKREIGAVGKVYYYDDVAGITYI